jgi:hypothetical protein
MSMARTRTLIASLKFRFTQHRSISGIIRRSPLALFTGTLDEVAIYPTALTALQIAAHYAAASPLVDLIVSDTEVTALAVTDTLLITS